MRSQPGTAIFSCQSEAKVGSKEKSALPPGTAQLPHGYQMPGSDASSTRDYAVLCGPAFSRFRRAVTGIAEVEEKMSIWTILFVVLLIAWLGGFTVFHVAGGLIHLLLVFAVISLILHFVMGSRTA